MEQSYGQITRSLEPAYEDSWVSFKFCISNGHSPSKTLRLRTAIISWSGLCALGKPNKHCQAPFRMCHSLCIMPWTYCSADNYKYSVPGSELLHAPCSLTGISHRKALALPLTHKFDQQRAASYYRELQTMPGGLQHNIRARAKSWLRPGWQFLHVWFAIHRVHYWTNCRTYCQTQKSQKCAPTDTLELEAGTICRHSGMDSPSY